MIRNSQFQANQYLTPEQSEDLLYQSKKETVAMIISDEVPARAEGEAVGGEEVAE